MGMQARTMLTTGLLLLLTGCCSPEPGANRAKALTQDRLMFLALPGRSPNSSFEPTPHRDTA
jgi:hypothetical protein